MTSHKPHSVNHAEHTEVRQVNIGDEVGADALRAVAAMLDNEDGLVLIGVWNVEGEYLQAVVTIARHIDGSGAVTE